LEALKGFSCSIWPTVPDNWKAKVGEALKHAIFCTTEATDWKFSGPVELIRQSEASVMGISTGILDDIDVEFHTPTEESPGDIMVIAHFKGNTTDINSFQSVSSENRPKLTDSIIARSASCGPEYVDHKVSTWLKNTFGDAFSKVAMKDRDILTNELESAKFKFEQERLRGDHGEYVRMPLKMEFKRSEFYRAKKQQIRIPVEDSLPTSFQCLLHIDATIVFQDAITTSLRRPGPKSNRIVERSNT
jgi:hypothetical protein